MQNSQPEPQTVDPILLSKGLRRIRFRRWCLWGVIGIYLPMMWVTLKTTRSFNICGIVFLIWFILLFAVALYSAVIRCPRCNNYFHVNGPTLLYLRKCLHCQLPVNADKKGKTPGETEPSA